MAFFYLGFMVIPAMITGVPELIAQDLYVRAKIDVLLQRETQTLRAKSKEWIRPGDTFKIYVLPKNTPLYMWCIRTRKASAF